MKKYLFALLCAVVLSPMSYGGNGKNGGPNANIPKHGGRLQLYKGIEEKKVNFGFNLGGGVAVIDAWNRECAPYAAKGSLFVHFLVPRTQTLGIGLEVGSFYLFANQEKFTKSLVATKRNGNPSTDIPTIASVGNWLLPVGQVSIMGNFHPIQRFNLQLKVNLGVVAPIIPSYTGDYAIWEIRPDGFYDKVKYSFSYDSKMNIGCSGTVGMKLLYAISPYAEFGVGVDWSYLRFSYLKKWTAPLPDVTKELTQIGILDLHVGIAFSF